MASYRIGWFGVATVLLGTASLRAADPPAIVDIGPAAALSRVPCWDARGLGQLPSQGVSCLDLSVEGRFLALGTIAPPGDPNLLLLDERGNIVGQHRAGLRWLNEVTVSDDGLFLAGFATTPEGTAGDMPRFFGFHYGKPLAQLSDRFRFEQYHPAGFLFHYGEHSNHLPRISGWAGDCWVVAGDDHVIWLPPGNPARVQQAALRRGVTTAFAASASGPVVVGRLADMGPPPDNFQNLLVLKPGPGKSVAWSRSVSTDVDCSPAPEKGTYGAATPPYEDVKFQAPLAVAIDAQGEQIAVADYEGWRRIFHPRDGSDDKHFGTRVMPSRPTIHVYDADGKTIRRVGPEAFDQAFWCDLAFSADGRKLLIWPHQWTSRGLGGQPFLPADKDARTLYVLDLTGGGLHAVRFPDAISSVAAGGPERIAVGCWDHNVYLLDRDYRPISSLPHGLNVGAASLVRAAGDGRRIAVATAAGNVRMLDSDGKELWQLDLNRAIPPGEKPWTKNQKPEEVAPGIWRTKATWDGRP